MGTAPARAREALDMIRAGLGYLAAADAAQLADATQADCLRELEQAGAVATAARASETGANDGAGLDGDAAMAPIVTGDVNVVALDDLVRLCVEVDARRDDARDAAWAAL